MSYSDLLLAYSSVEVVGETEHALDYYPLHLDFDEYLQKSVAEN